MGPEADWVCTEGEVGISLAIAVGWRDLVGTGAAFLPSYLST